MFICEKNEETHIIHRRKEDDYALELEMRQLGRWGGGRQRYFSRIHFLIIA